ncbi:MULTISPECIES: hypothetical protein [unclassified Microcoleus]|uniref:hypothetical protein n=1 Tax=unclassified Microcoleus TaxID=2642155 RepID=UPI002FD12812
MLRNLDRPHASDAQCWMGNIIKTHCYWQSYHFRLEILDFRLAMAYYVKVWSLPTVASFFHTGGQNLVFLFYRPNYPNQQLKSPPAVR